MSIEKPFVMPPGLRMSMSGDLRDAAGTVQITYGFVSVPFGSCLAAFSDKGLCWLEPGQEADSSECPITLAGHWKTAVLVRDDLIVQRKFNKLLHAECSVRVHMCGTEFQLRVWKELLKIPFGSQTSYGHLAAALGAVNSARAVGSAVGKNHIAWFVPCHRVLPAGGGLGGYRWGVPLKRRLLAAEQQRIPKAIPA
jgi:AraC family transcriptional regulator of adaptative response/methylated-DNA-[protein]-cysteine methyltransferase